MHVPRSGLTYSSYLEWILAAQWAHYRWHEFAELDGEEQSFIVAAYRCYIQNESVVSYEQQKKIKNKRPPGHRPSRG